MGTYASYEYARKLPYAIVNKLVESCPELWKLMKYSQPMGKENLTIDEISNMICPDSMNMDRYNVVFQKFSQQAFGSNEDGKVFSQMRLQVLNGYPTNRTTGRIEVLLEFVVNEKQMVCSTDLTPFDNRAMAMTQSVISCLNGKQLNSIDNNVVFMDGTQDRNTGFKLVNYNNEYSGYAVIMSANILG